MSSLSIMRRSFFSSHCRRVSLVLGLLGALRPVDTAAATPDGAVQPGVSPYCDYAESSARSAVVGQLFPKLFVSGGVVTDAEAIDLSGRYDALATLWRIQAGLSYSLADRAEALANRARAQAECVLYQYQSELFAFLARYDEPDSVAGARARIEVLAEALPKAEQILEAQRDLLQRHQSTVEELNATSVRVDELRAEIGSSRARVAVSEQRHAVLQPAVGEVMRRYRVAVEQAARSESRARMSRSYDVSLRGGYDRIFGVRDGVPLFAMLTLTISPAAMLRQPALEQQAQHGRFGWASQGVEGIYDRVAVLLSRLQAVSEAQLRRRADAKLLLADLEVRYRAIESLEGDSVRAYRDYLWFDLTRLRGESAYLDAQVEELHALLGHSDQ